MARDDSSTPRDPERKRSTREPERRPAERAAGSEWRRGHSGYGLESIRPHLRAQIEQRKLLRPTFPPEDEPPDGSPGSR